MKEYPKMDVAELGKRIRAARRKKKLSQNEMAEACGISVPYISDIENGKKCVGIDIFFKIVEALDVSADWLLRADASQKKHLTNADAAELLEDCSPEEAMLLLELMANIKHTLRKGKK